MTTVAPPTGVDEMPAHTVDAFHRGRFWLVQPKLAGHRAGMDAMTLAAAVPSSFSGRLADFGAGAGAAALAVLSRCSGAEAVLVERAAEMSTFAAATLSHPGNAHLGDRASLLSADVTLSGRARAAANAKTLAAIEKRFGVPGSILLAIWGRETGFGAAKMPYDAFEVLGTKAFLSARKDFFRTELLAALEIVERGLEPVGAMKSSWAGALGQPQFMPTSFLKHAVDFDGDGRVDIWNSVPDVLGSIANYLDHYGWVKGRGWGFEVTVPATVSCSLEGPDQGKKIADWAAMGIKRVGGKPFPAAELKAEGFLLMPAGRSGPAFVVTPNFYVIKQYNNSDLYGLFISHAADRIASGDSNFAGKWGDVGGLLRSDIAALQRALEAKGYDVGSADGLPGFKTRRSIGKWQAKNGRPATCFPEADLVSAVK